MAAAVFLLAVPIFALLSSSLSDVQSSDGSPTLANFQAVLAHPLFAPVAWNTLMLGAGTVACQEHKELGPESGQWWDSC